MIKFFSGQWSGAPELSGTVGALKAILKACLCDGFGVKTPSAVVITSGVAVLTVTAPHTFREKAIAKIAGVTVTGGTLNGDRRVLSQSSTSVSVDATGIPDQTASLSTPTIRVSPLGWTELFPGTANKFAAKSSQMDSTGMCIRVDDDRTSQVRGARIRGYESMTDIDTGVGLFPNDGQSNGGYWWRKSSAADTSPRAWTLVGDEYAFYLSVGPNQGPTSLINRDCYFFGDLKAVQPGDPYACVLAGADETGHVDSNNVTQANLNAAFGNFNSYTRSIARRFSGIGGSAPAVHVNSARMTFDNSSQISGGTQWTTPYPATPGNLLLMAPVFCCEPGNGYNIRGTFPGLYHIPQNLNGNLGSDTFVPGSGVYAGKDFLAVVGGAGAGGLSDGAVLFDLSAPWR